VTATDELIRRHIDGIDSGAPTVPTPIPGMHVAIVTCMDARIKVFDVFGLKHGEAHILRNAGGVITDDMIRSLALSQRKLETREVIIMQHTTCGLNTVTEDSFKDEIAHDTGIRPPWAVEAFRDLDGSVRESIERIRLSPFVPYRDAVRGFAYDTATAELREIT
jgi:carbonic anhydrase